MATWTLQEVRRHFDRLLDRLRAEPEHPLVVTGEEGEPVLVVLSWVHYEALAETLDLSSDEQVMDQIRRSDQDIEEGRTLSTDEAWRQLGW